MKRQVLVIGLGQFGLSLVRSLSAIGVEVMAVDRSEEKVRVAATFAAAASCVDATDEAALASIAPERRDVCICAIGDEAREASIICTALLRQMGAPRILARATDTLHERILGLVGAHEVINPESMVGQRVALRIAYDGVLEELPLGDDLVITQIATPPAFVGRSLVELALPTQHQLMVVAIRTPDAVQLPRADARLADGDVLVLVSRPGAVAEMMERIS